ncbi:MAG: DUF4384 domain-containing protein [Richelia sp. SM1_7_0]|nr:DUF4384 domain-containing protein [Richelia sp. SM1_7_0]
MSNIKRRQFLQFAGSTLTALGLSQFDIKNQSLRYAKAISSSNSRKLALLVGINNYQNFDNLKGAITDIHLQKELLVNRFGFNPNDILTVSDESKIKPTRENILQAFEEHLIKQAKPGDTVVYHFSGHGSQVFEQDSPFEDNLRSTFVPNNRSISLTGNQKTVSDITGKTLFLLMSNIETENLTVVLDSCYSGGGKRGNLNIRSTEGGNTYLSNNVEIEYQQKLLSKLAISEEELKQRRKTDIAKGIVIASARKDQIAAEAYLDNFVAGAFTYLMTQYLWQQTSNSPVENVIANISRSIIHTFSSSQIPEFSGKTNTRNQTKPIYFISQATPPAEAVITEVNSNNVDLWLGGVSPQALSAFNQNTILQLIDNQGKEQGKIQLESRDGLKGTGRILELKNRKLLKPGALLKEAVRVIPPDYKLLIGLDDSLGKDIAFARNEIAKIERIEPIYLRTGEVHYIFGRMTEVRQAELRNKQVQNIPELNSFGLYTEGLDLIPYSFGSSGETIGNALSRLKSKFRSLLAARILKLTLNANSSRLKVFADLNVDNQVTLDAEILTLRLAKDSEFNANTLDNPNLNYKNGILQIPFDTSVQFLVKNQEPHDLYITILIINPQGKIDVLFPFDWSAPENASLVKANETIQIPNPEIHDWGIKITEPLGLSEALVVASKSPLRNHLQSLQTIAKRQGKRNSPVDIGDDFNYALGLLLEDISSSSLQVNRNRNNSNPSSIKSRKEVRVDTTKIKAMSITYEAVKQP